MNPYLLSAGAYAKRNPWQTTIIILVVLAILVYFYVKSPLFEAQNVVNDLLRKVGKNPFDQQKPIEQIQVTGPVTINEAQAENYAEMLHEAVDGTGTDLTTIKSVFSQINANDLVLIHNAYGIRKRSIFSWNRLSLISNLRKDMSHKNYKNIVLPLAQEAGLA